MMQQLIKKQQSVFFLHSALLPTSTPSFFGSQSRTFCAAKPLKKNETSVNELGEDEFWNAFSQKEEERREAGSSSSSMLRFVKDNESLKQIFRREADDMIYPAVKAIDQMTHEDVSSLFKNEELEQLEQLIKQRVGSLDEVPVDLAVDSEQFTAHKKLVDELISHLYDSSGVLSELIFTQISQMENNEHKNALLGNLNTNLLIQSASQFHNFALVEQLMFESTVCGASIDMQTYIKTILQLYYSGMQGTVENDQTGESYDSKQALKVLYAVFKNDSSEDDFKFGCELIYEYVNAIQSQMERDGHHASGHYDDLNFENHDGSGAQSTSTSDGSSKKKKKSRKYKKLERSEDDFVHVQFGVKRNEKTDAGNAGNPWNEDFGSLGDDDDMGYNGSRKDFFNLRMGKSKFNLKKANSRQKSQKNQSSRHLDKYQHQQHFIKNSDGAPKGTIDPQLHQANMNLEIFGSSDMERPEDIKEFSRALADMFEKKVYAEIVRGVNPANLNLDLSISSSKEDNESSSASELEQDLDVKNQGQEGFTLDKFYENAKKRKATTSAASSKNTRDTLLSTDEEIESASTATESPMLSKRDKHTLKGSREGSRQGGDVNSKGASLGEEDGYYTTDTEGTKSILKGELADKVNTGEQGQEQSLSSAEGPESGPSASK